MSKSYLPPKPDKFVKLSGVSHLFNINQEFMRRADFEEWYAQQIEPLFENTVEVYKARGMSFPDDWTTSAPVENRTHIALLINIQPIKEPTADDLLKEILGEGGHTPEWNEKAVAYLERKQKESK
jgi:hypothetical protein